MPEQRDDRTDGRRPAEVLDDHLRQRRSGTLEADLQRNYADDVVLLTPRGRFHGIDGVRETESHLSSEVDAGAFDYDLVLVDGDIGYLRWTGRTHDGKAVHGTDSYVFRDGRIAVQTIFFAIAGEVG